jgi:nucleoid-associated protein YgaU
MTRETKVGLLVGVAIILLIGIIVSDYLSASKNDKPPELTDFAPGIQQNLVSPNLPFEPEQGVNNRGFGQQVSNQQGQGQGIITQGPTQPGGNQQGPIITPRDPELARQRLIQQQQQQANGGTNPQAGQSQGQGQQQNQNDAQAEARRRLVEDLQRQRQQIQQVIHVVKPGDSVWMIAKKHFGDGEKWRLIQKANPTLVDKHGNVREGARLTIPRVTESPAAPANGARIVAVGNNTSSSGAILYTAQEGDSLWSIAKAKLGEGKEYTRILAMNISLLRGNAKNLKAGMKLKLPVTR